MAFSEGLCFWETVPSWLRLGELQALSYHGRPRTPPQQRSFSSLPPPPIRPLPSMQSVGTESGLWDFRVYKMRCCCACRRTQEAANVCRAGTKSHKEQEGRPLTHSGPGYSNAPVCLLSHGHSAPRGSTVVTHHTVAHLRILEGSSIWKVQAPRVGIPSSTPPGSTTETVASVRHHLAG